MSSSARVQEMPIPALNVTHGGAAACTACPRAAFFQVRVERPPGHTSRRANACATDLVEVIEQTRAWARDRHLTGGWLTVLAIDPYALPRLAALGIPEPGFAFYSAPVTATPITAALSPDYPPPWARSAPDHEERGYLWPPWGPFLSPLFKNSPRPLWPVASGTGDKADTRCSLAHRIQAGELITSINFLALCPVAAVGADGRDAPQVPLSPTSPRSWISARRSASSSRWCRAGRPTRARTRRRWLSASRTTTARHGSRPPGRSR